MWKIISGIWVGGWGTAFVSSIGSSYVGGTYTLGGMLAGAVLVLASWALGAMAGSED